MDLFQNIAAYAILVFAIGYLVWKFFLPKALVRSKKSHSKGCGQDNCGCS